MQATDQSSVLSETRMGKVCVICRQIYSQNTADVLLRCRCSVKLQTKSCCWSRTPWVHVRFARERLLIKPFSEFQLVLMEKNRRKFQLLQCHLLRVILHRILEQHHRSLTGITPTAKRQKLISHRGYSGLSTYCFSFWLTQADWQQALQTSSLCQVYRTSIAKTLLEWSWYCTQLGEFRGRLFFPFLD